MPFVLNSGRMFPPVGYILVMLLDGLMPDLEPLTNMYCNAHMLTHCTKHTSTFLRQQLLRTFY